MAMSRWLGCLGARGIAVLFEIDFVEVVAGLSSRGPGDLRSRASARSETRAELVVVFGAVISAWDMGASDCRFET